MSVQELQPPVQEQPVTPVISGQELVDFNPAEAAERILQQPSVAEGADAYLQSLEAPVTPEQNANVEFDPALLQMFMFLGRMGASDEVKAVKDVISSALAIDAAAKQNGAEELTLDYVRKQNNAHAAQQSAEVQARLAKEAAEKDEEDL
ncbi:MAG: hypothetical protein ABWX94_01700 [Candidatus Saccharimonadales bacterium]